MIYVVDKNFYAICSSGLWVRFEENTNYDRYLKQCYSENENWLKYSFHSCVETFLIRNDTKRPLDKFCLMEMKE